MSSVNQKRGRVIVVGINPSNYSTKAKNRKNHTFDRLARWQDYLGLPVVSFTNCIYSKGEYKAKDVDLDYLSACIGNNYDRVFALGNFVSDILKKIGVDHYRLPHPSPRNRKFNDPAFEKQMLEDCRMYLYD